MDKEYIIKHNLMEAHKQFMRLSEGYLATDLSEDDDENQGQPEPQSQAPAGEQLPPEGGDMGDMGGMPNGDMSNDGAPEEGMPPQEDMPEQTPPMEPAGAPMPDEGMDDMDDDVLDVEDLTQAQEKLNKKQNSLGHDLSDVDNRIVALLNAVEKIQGSLEKNNHDITDLKAELEKRVPTNTEKLNMQSLKMYPFNVSPNEYWKDKERDGRYEAQEKDKVKEYKIKQKDVDDYTDTDIENSFDEKLHQTMEDIFRGF